MTDRNDETRVVEEFGKRRTRQYVAIVPAIVMVVAAVIAKHHGSFLGLEMSVVGPIAAIVVGGVLVFSFVNWRCPACNGYLGRGASPKFCRKCGARLGGD